MTATLSLTAAGRAAAADAANVGTKAVQLRRLAVGSGLRPVDADDDAIAALRNSRDVQDVVGSASTPGHIAFRADIEPSADYSVTEVGLWARVGDAGPLFLFGYWAAESAGDAAAAAAQGTTLVLAGLIAITSSDADIDVTPALTVRVGGVSPPDASLTTKGLVELATRAEHRTGTSEALAATPRGVDARISDILGSATSGENTLGKLGDLIDAVEASVAALSRRVAATEAFGARITALEDQPVGNETLLYQNSPGLVVGNASTYAAAGLGDDITDYDAIRLMVRNRSDPVTITDAALVDAIGHTTGTAQRIKGGGANVYAYRASARSLRVAGLNNGRLYAVIGIKYDRP